VPPASPDHPDDQAAVDGRAAIDAVLEPLREETDRADRELADNHRFLEERRSRRLDAETRDLLNRAARSPQAPVSLRRLARRIAGGELTWEDVFAHRGGPDGDAFLLDAFHTARERFSDAELSPVRVPEGALETGVDPSEVDADLDRVLQEGREQHDAIFRRAFESGDS
jgi:hypothetical protein